MLNQTQIEELVQLPLTHLVQQYPNHIMHCLNSADDVLSPRQLHPIFYGCYDWHSAVHGYWLLLRGIELAPDLRSKADIINRFEHHFTTENLAVEFQYFTADNRGSFERPYGYAWLLALTAKLSVSSLEQAPRWLAVIAPLAELLSNKLIAYLANLPYAIRVGTHYNTAFALILSLEYAQVTQHQPLLNAIKVFCQRCFGADTDYPLHYEPNGDDFLSGGLCEALLMSRVLDYPATWLENFLPGLVHSQLPLSPAKITDPSDAKLSHLEGLNLSRSWCLKQIAKQLPKSKIQGYCRELAEQHLNASIHNVIGSHYSGSHWLATFALLALEP